MGVQVLTQDPPHSKHLRSLPRLPKNSHYSMKPTNNAKPRALPTVPNSNLAKVDSNLKITRALPRVPKPPTDRKVSNFHRHGRVLPEVPYKDVKELPFKDTNSNSYKDGNTSSSSRTSTPHLGHAPSVNTTQRTLPKLPKLLQKQKPEQNRIEYMHDVYKKEGDRFGEDGNYEQALKSYNLALKFISDERTTIIARSRVYRKLGKNRKAMQDADLALKLDPIHYEALLQKAELLLEQGDYEHALEFFQKGARMRPDREDFHDGIEKARHGISETHKVARKRKNTLSPEDITGQKKTKDKAEKLKKNRDNVNFQTQRAHATHSDDAHNNSYGSHGSSNRESVITEEAPPMIPAPPPQPPPPNSRAKIMNGRQMTPMPGRLRARQHQQPSQPTNQQQPVHVTTQKAAPIQEDTPQAPPTEEEVDEDMMKQILGRMYADKDYLEKFLGETENISMPGTSNLGGRAEHGLHFLYDRVLNWVRKGEAVPATKITPLPRETRTSARRKAMAMGSSVESLIEEQEKENDQRLRKRKKRHLGAGPAVGPAGPAAGVQGGPGGPVGGSQQSKAPHSWYSYLEHKKAEEALERKHSKNTFLHVVEGRRIRPKGQVDAKKSKAGPETTRRSKDGALRRSKEHDSKESLTHSFLFQSYRPGSDVRVSRDSKGTPMEMSDVEEQQVRTPPRKMKRYGIHKEKLERRRAAVAKFAAKELEEIEIAYADGKLTDCIDKSRHVLKILEHEDWPEKYATMATLHSFLGNSYISRKEYELGLSHHNQDLEIGEKHKLDEAVSRALGHLGRVYVLQKRHQEALDVFLRKTPMCTSRIETAWLFHEVGNCFLALGDFEYAKDAAKKSLEAAEEAVEWSYQLQSCVLMGVAEVKLKQYHAAFNTFERALDQARLQGDEKAEEAIRDALQDVNDRIVEEMRTKGPLNYPDARSDVFTTPFSRSNTTLTDYQLMGLSRSRAAIAKMEAEIGYRCRADYARTPGANSDYSSIIIPDDDGDISLTDTAGDPSDLNLDLERLKTDSTIFGSSMDIRDNIRSETFVSGKFK